MHDLVVTKSWGMNEAICHIVHLAEISKHIVQLLAQNSLTPLPHCQRGYSCEVWANVVWNISYGHNIYFSLLIDDRHNASVSMIHNDNYCDHVVPIHM